MMRLIDEVRNDIKESIKLASCADTTSVGIYLSSELCAYLRQDTDLIKSRLPFSVWSELIESALIQFDGGLKITITQDDRRREVKVC